MPSIKFSHNYAKLDGQKSARLLDIVILDAKAVQANIRLVEYDTKYIPANLANSCACELHTDYEGDIEHCHYHLPKSGELIQLVFIGDTGIPFCTIRSRKGRYGDKYDYYKPLIGGWFDVVVKEA